MSKLDNLIKESKGNRRSVNSQATKEDIEIALAWCRGEISQAQIQKCFDMNHGASIYIYLLCALKTHINKK